MNIQQSPLVEHSVRVYRALLWLYPREYRTEFGWLMVQLFRDKAYDAYVNEGKIGIFWSWITIFADLFVSIITEHRESGFSFSLQRMAQIRTPLMLFGGLLITISAFGKLKPLPWYQPSLVYDTADKLMIPGFFLFGIGFLGVYVANRQLMSIIAKLSIVVVVLGCLILGITSILQTTFNVNYWNEQAWGVFMGMFMVIVLSLFVFGINLGRQGYRFAWVMTAPLIIMLMTFAYLVLTGNTGNQYAGPYWDGFIGFFTFGICILYLGYAFRLPLRKKATLHQNKIQDSYYDQPVQEGIS